MPLLLLLMAFMPSPDPVQVGEDAPRLERSPALQGAWNASASARHFRARWGRWSIRWDERDASPRALLGEGVPSAALDELVEDVAALSGLPGSALELVSQRDSQERQSWHYRLVLNGAPVVGGGLDVYAQRGRIHFMLASLHPLRPAAQDRGLRPLAGERWLLLDGAPLSHRLVRPTQEQDLVRFTDRQGVVVHSYSLRFPLDLTVEERTVGDALIQVPARQVTLTDSSGTELTDDLGAHSRLSPYDAVLTGPSLEVWRGGALVSVSGVTDELLNHSVDLSPASATVLHHAHVARDWLEQRRPDHPWLSGLITATVDISSACCNAFYSSGTINFYAEGSGWNNLGRIADVVYHEYGHGVHHYILEGGTFAGDVSEGSADYVAATLLDDPILAPYARLDGSYIREVDTDRVYPDDIIGEVHNDGLIWASFLWNLRDQWIDTYGYEEGVERTDLLFLESLSKGPTLTDLYEVVLAADDDNGDISDGTPHACELDALLRQHGLGGEPLSAVVLDHEPLGPQGSNTLSYPVEFSLSDLIADCGAGTLGSVDLHYAVDPDPKLPLDQIPFTTLNVVGVSGVYYTEIPRQPAGSQVVYYLSWTSSDGSVSVSSHGGLSQNLYSFWVGDREDLWCEGFETGAAGWEAGAGLPAQTEIPPEWRSQWEVAPPEAQAFSPSSAAEGSRILGTQVTGDGLYAPNNGQHVHSPTLTLDGAHPAMLLLATQRQLTVEDALYDQARIILLDEASQPQELLWSNPLTEAGTAHVLDPDWTLQELDLRGWAGRSIQLDWSLVSDPGLEFSGWSLDEVCLRTLAEPERHYQAASLRASDEDAQVTVTWSAPWVRPLYATALVRNTEHPPERVTDGTLLDIDFDPSPGEARALIDPEILPGETAYYALFSAWDEAGFIEGATQDENLDEGGVPAPEDTDPPEDSADSEPPMVQDDPPLTSPEALCSCASAQPSPAPGLVLLLALLLRRRSGRYERRHSSVTMSPCAPPDSCGS